MIENELYIRYNILFASAKMHVRFAAALLFFLIEASFFHTSNPFAILRKKVLW